MLPVNTEDIGVGMDEKIHKFSNTIPIETRNEAVGGYERRNEGTQIVPMHIEDDESSNDDHIIVIVMISGVSSMGANSGSLS